MRILYLDQYFYTAQQAGRMCSYPFARHLVDHGHAVTVVAPCLGSFTGTAPDRYRGRLLLREEVEGIRVIRTFSYPGFMPNARVRLLNRLSFMALATAGSLVAGPCDVVYATWPALTVGLAGYAVSRVKGVPLVLEVRDLWPEGPITLDELEVYDAGVPAKKPALATARKVASFLYRRAARIVVLTPAQRPLVVEQGGREDRVVTISAGLDPQTVKFLPEARSRLRQELGVEDKFVVTCASTCGFNQKLDVVLDVAEYLLPWPEVVFWLIGAGPNRETMQQAAHERGLGNVTFVDAPSYQCTPEWLSASDLGLVVLSGTPAHRIVWPDKLFHYMACERPVLVNFDGLARQLLEDFAAGYYVPSIPALMAERILDLCEKRDECARLGQNGRACIVQHFDIEDKARALEGLFLGLLAERRARRRAGGSF